MLLPDRFLPALSSFQPVTIYAAITTFNAKKSVKKEFMFLFQPVIVSVYCVKSKNGEANLGRQDPGKPFDSFHHNLQHS